MDILPAFVTTLRSWWSSRMSLSYGVYILGRETSKNKKTDKKNLKIKKNTHKPNTLLTKVRNAVKNEECWDSGEILA